MEIIPAIDIRNGKCVRLYQGNYSQETVYSPEPDLVARRWESQGVKRIHVVDLDGAASGKPENVETIKLILAAVKIPLQLGGGIRDRATVKRYLELGIDRVVLGTAAVETPGLVKELCNSCGDRIVVGIDARDGMVASHGWEKATSISAIELARQMTALGARRIVYTDISRDGTLTSPNFGAIAGLVARVKARIIASGGVATISHFTRLAKMGVEGVIVGKALYTGDVDLGQALEAIAGEKENAT